MKPRLNALTVPETPRYWSVEVEEKGEHHFRFPSYSRASLAVDFRNARMTRDGVATWIEQAGILLGMCWWHRGMELTTQPPHMGSSHQSLAEYSEAVIDELQEAGYTLAHIDVLYAAALPRMTEYTGDLIELYKPMLDKLEEAKAEAEAEDGEDEEPEGVEWTEDDQSNPGPFVDRAEE